MAEKEYIERDAVLEIVKRTNGDYAAAFAEISRLPTAAEMEVMACAKANLKYAKDSLEILRQINHKISSPSDDVAPVVHGEWIFDFRHGNMNFYKCSLCGRQEELLVKESADEYFPYCHCGARMDGGKT